MVAKNKMQDAVAVENGRTVVLTADVPPVAYDGLPIPHKRAQWSPAEVVKFVAVWNGSSSMPDVVAAMNRSLAACYSMAKQCRKNGIQLKVLGRSAGLDWSVIKSSLPG